MNWIPKSRESQTNLEFGFFSCVENKKLFLVIHLSSINELYNLEVIFNEDNSFSSQYQEEKMKMELLRL